MNAIIINERIAERVFDDKSFRNELISALNELIDSELSKSDCEISFENIDIYCEALNKIYNGEDIDKVFMTLQTLEEMRDFINSDKRFTLLKRAAKITLAACAVLAITLTANSVAEETTGYNFLKKMAQAVKTVFTGGTVNGAEEYNSESQRENKAGQTDEARRQIQEESTTEPDADESGVYVTEQGGQNVAPVSPPIQKPPVRPQNPDLTQVLSPETQPTVEKTETETREPFTRADDDSTAAPVVIKLTPEYSGSFKRYYAVGEKADFSGLTVTAVYDSGAQRNVPISKCNIYGFSTATPANRIVTVEYEGCSFSYLIRVGEGK